MTEQEINDLKILHGLILFLPLALCSIFNVIALLNGFGMPFNIFFILGSMLASISMYGLSKSGQEYLKYHFSNKKTSSRSTDIKLANTLYRIYLILGIIFLILGTFRLILYVIYLTSK